MTAINVAECIHCGSLTLNPESDECACGEELYPVSKTVPPGTRIVGAGLDQIAIPSKAPEGSS
jgi:hypothetical protein